MHCLFFSISYNEQSIKLKDENFRKKTYFFEQIYLKQARQFMERERKVRKVGKTQAPGSSLIII